MHANRIMRLVCPALLGLLVAYVPLARAGDYEDARASFEHAKALQTQGHPNEAAQEYQVAIELAIRVWGPQAENTTAAILNLGNIYREMGQLDKSERLYFRTLQNREALYGPNHPLVADSLNNIGLNFAAKGEFDKAVPYYERSLKIREANLGPDHESVGDSYLNLGNLYTETGQYAKAEVAFQHALKIYQARLGPNHVNVAMVVGNLGRLYLLMGQAAKAEPFFQQSLKINEANLGPDHPEVAKSLNNLAVTYFDLGLFAKAAPFYERSLRIREARLGQNHPDLAQSFSNLASLYARMGEFDRAQSLCERALRIQEAVLGGDHLDIAQTLNNLGDVLRGMGQYARAEPLLLRCVQIRETKLGPMHQLVGAALNNLAVTYWSQDKFDKAEPCFQRCLKIYENAEGADPQLAARTLGNLALMHYDMGRSDDSEALYERALKIEQDQFGPEHYEVSRTLGNLALFYYGSKQYEKSEATYQRALKIIEATVGPDHPDASLNHNNQAWLHELMGKSALAADDCDRSRRIVRRYVARVLPALSEREQLTYLETEDQKHYFAALTFGEEHRDDPPLVARSYGWLLNGKAVAQQSLADQALVARDSRDPALAAGIKALRDARNELATLSQTAPKSGEAAAHRARLAELTAKEEALARQVNLAAGRPAEVDPWVEPDAVRRPLADDALLIDIVRFEPKNLAAQTKDDANQPTRYFAWLVPPAGKGDIKIVDLGLADAIDAAVARVRTGLADAIGGPQKQGLILEQGEPEAQAALAKPLEALAALVLAPILQQAGDARQLVLSPDASLWLVPWGALPLADGRFAIEAYQIRYLVTARDLALAGAKSAAVGRPVMMADPNFDLGPAEAQAATRAVFRGAGPGAGDLAVRGATREGSLIGHVDRLPGTAKEAQAIAPKLAAYTHADPTLYSDKYALEGVFKALQRPRVLVMSTHGFFLPDQVAHSADSQAADSAGADSRGAPLAADGKPLENPLLRCGLLLAGCNRRGATIDGSDGVLTGMEIVSADLRGTEFVTLSACETGLGQVHNGEGVAGLRQAFQIAGAQAVVATLWQIPDRESAQLMTDFFSNLAAGQPKAEALRNAQLTMIAQRREKFAAAHPFYWAAFTLTGN